MYRLAPAAAGLLLALALGGCGGTTTSPTATAGVPTVSPAAPSPVGPSPEPGSPDASPSPAAGACADSIEPGTVDVTIQNFAFGPDPVQASVGDVVEWTNQDSAPHSAVITGIDCATETLAQGESGALVFTEAGSYPYVCGIHPSMTGTVEVR